MNTPGMPNGEGADLMTDPADAARMLDVEFYIEAAQQHGEDSEPDHEVGDLQDFLRAMWAVLSVEQRRQFARARPWRTCSVALVRSTPPISRRFRAQRLGLSSRQPRQGGRGTPVWSMWPCTCIRSRKPMGNRGRE